MDTTTNTTAAPLKRFLVALPIFDRSEHQDADDGVGPWVTPHSQVFTVRAANAETATEAMYNLVEHEATLLDLLGLPVARDEEGNAEGTLAYCGYYVGTPVIVEIVGEAIGVPDIGEALVASRHCERPAEVVLSREAKGQIVV